ncbi:MAG: hypothetical protein QXI91_02065 [Candidatus Bathyarchaeia archaeon]
MKTSEVSPTYNEPPLKVRGYAITYLWAFDVGASNLRVRVKPKNVVEELLSLGYAVACTAYTEKLKRVSIEVGGLFIKRYLKSKLKNAGENISRRNFEGLLKEAKQEFTRQTELLDAFGWWDNIQVPVYVRLGRLARATFPQIKIKLPYDEDFRTASVVASVYVGGAACNRFYKMRSAECVSNELVDISPSVGVSGFFSQNTMLRICSDDFWDEAFSVLDAVPTHGDVIGDVACFGLLNCLLILHETYDLLLTRVLSEGVKELVEAENRVVAGLEEIYEARHQIYGSVSDWWWLAEEKLGISELNKAVNEKLSRIHTIITTKTEQKTNTRLTTLTVITAILTTLTIIPIIEKYVLPILPPLPPAPANTLPLALAIMASIILTATAIHIAPYTATMFLKILAKIPIRRKPK